jgi:hypothetical protein
MTMMLARITPGPSGFDIRTFECPACNLGLSFLIGSDENREHGRSFSARHRQR